MFYETCFEPQNSILYGTEKVDPAGASFPFSFRPRLDPKITQNILHSNRHIESLDAYIKY
jgi:hypothetical protein